MLYVLKANPVELNQEKLNQILEAADFNQLVGFAETSEFECKGAPYQLDKESQKRELAKDISSFANAKGGKIIIGLKTKPSTTHFGDEIEEVRGFAQGLVDTAQYRDVVNSWVYPRIEGLEVTWVATSEDRSKGVVVIAIPPQKDTVKPFLISKTLDDEKRVEIVFGYAERKGDESEPFSIVDLQTALRAGFNYENTLKDRLDGLEDLIREGGEHIVTQTMKEEQQKNLDKRVEFALSHGDFLKKK